MTFAKFHLCAFALTLLAVSAHASDTTMYGVLSDTTGRVMRDALTAQESAANQPAHFVLKMRNYAELEARIAKGDVISQAEMAAKYYPTSASWQHVAEWVQSRGLTVNPEDATHMTVFAHGSVQQVGYALHVKFSRVRGTDGGEYTSATGNPVVSSDVATELLAVLELQPHLRPHSNQSAITPIGIPISGGTVNGAPNPNSSYALSPVTVAQWYHVNDLGFKGTGQTIVILGLSAIAPSDLTAFWAKVNVPVTLAQFREVDLTTPKVSTSDSSETTKDVEWASSMAPGANIIYLTSLVPSTFATWILNNLAANPGIHQVSMSYSIGEDSTPNASLNAQSQSFAALAAAGITVFASSGDYGSNAQTLPSGSPPAGGTFYDPAGPLGPEYPASDPNVTAVGGTSLYCTPLAPGHVYPGTPIIEGAWSLPTVPTLPIPGHVLYFGDGCSTGGLSSTFSRPPWQVGAGVVTTGNFRNVPDVAAMASGEIGAYAYFNGADSGFGGTSLSCPIWGGIAAVVNQALANAGKPPIGLAGPKFYPLLGTSAFNAMPTGSADGADPFTSTATSGAFTVGPNYDLITGIGTPNVTNLINALSSLAAPPTITQQPQSVSTTAGTSATFSVTATGSGTLSYQWTFNGAAISGATGSSFTKSNVASTDGGSYGVQVTNSGGSVTSSAATLTVTNPSTAPVTSAPAPSSGGGGGGGAPSWWFYLALFALFAYRFTNKKINQI